MFTRGTEAAIAIFSAIACVAIVAVLVSGRSKTAEVVQAIFGGYAAAIREAVAPAMGGGNN